MSRLIRGHVAHWSTRYQFLLLQHYTRCKHCMNEEAVPRRCLLIKAHRYCWLQRWPHVFIVLLGWWATTYCYKVKHFCILLVVAFSRMWLLEALITRRSICNHDQESGSVKNVLDHLIIPFRSSRLLDFTRVQRINWVLCNDVPGRVEEWHILYSCKAAFWIQEMSPRLSVVEHSLAVFLGMCHSSTRPGTSLRVTQPNPLSVLQFALTVRPGRVVKNGKAWCESSLVDIGGQGLWSASADPHRPVG